MNEKLKDVLKWGKFNAIVGIITSALSMLSCVGIPVGILMLMGYMKLNNATDELKQLVAVNPNPSAQDYENILAMYGNYLKMLSIGWIVSIVMGLVVMVVYFLFFAVMFSAFSPDMYY